MTVDSIFYIIFLFLFGLALGSFLNVIIYRLPRKESIIFPGSHCPSCGTPIKYRDNIPVMGYIFLRGRCRRCSSPISVKYPLIELFTGCMVVILYFIHGFNINFAADIILGSILLVAAVIDEEHMIIPNRLTYPGFIIAIILSLRWGLKGIIRGFCGIFPGLIILGFMYIIGKLLFKRESIGMGDFKLIFVIGFFVGPLWSTVIVFLAILIGGFWGLFQLLAGKKHIGQEVPFGPFISAGGFIVLFFRDQLFFLIDQYVKMF